MMNALTTVLIARIDLVSLTYMIPRLVLSIVLLSIGSSCTSDLTYERYPSGESLFHDPNTVLLVEAARNRDLNKVVKQLKSGVDPNKTGRNGRTPMWWSTTTPEIFKQFLAYGGDVEVLYPSGGLLHHIACCESLEILSLALESGADPNLADVDGEPPLFAAVNGPGIGRVELLLKHGADPSYETLDGNLPVARAASYEEYDIVLFLLQNGAEYRPTGGAIASLERHVERDRQANDISGPQKVYFEKVIEFLETEESLR